MAVDTYTYKVRDSEGRTLQGQLEADNSELVASKLRSMGYVPVAIDRQGGGAMKKELKIPGIGNKVNQKEISVFARQFATMINAGLSLIRALHILGEQTESKLLKEIVTEVRLDVEKGASLSQALTRHPKAFNRLFVAMVKAGEVGGVLDSVLMQLASIIEKQVELKRKIKSAMTYPVAVLALVLLIVTAMLLFIVPTFESLYADLGGTLPLPTRLLLIVSGIVSKFAPVIFVVEVVFVVLFKRWIASESGRAKWDVFKLKVPVFGKLVHKTAITRFSRTFAVLLRSGVPILEALEITSETVGNTVVASAIKDVQTAVKQGESVAGPLGRHPIFPPMVVQMLAVGEETGNVDEMLEKVADFYDAEIEAIVDALTSLLEPLLIVVMGGAVGGMVVALYMPMFQIINLVQ
ncbi:MAG: Type IV fimbrial assembly protein PilC [uncultured Acidimicrobiales bacterium]|uniref:Type IV fimbrial assembly protein PilC n=1 Tax=uncultured Acidimicrobiales bacterium TaxID=310071 RepID=A0A6J4HHR0_9ACTN|nr:MAG: Type IV fimbrial assembly protein PilC [uncultured Acidimicrobiales bacterium]